MNFRFFILFAAISMLVISVGQSQAQNNSREFIESSSPLANGDRVTSRSEPGRDVQTVITVSAESIAKRREESRQQRIDLTTQRVQQNAGANNVGNTISAAGRYPYPTTRTPTPSTYQLPTLGIGSVRTARRAQLFSDCNCNPQTFAAGRAPVAATQVPALQAPSLTIQDPTQIQAGFQQPVVNQGVVQQPQFGFQNNNGWWNPIVTGSGVYQPIVRLANVRPGTYLGQGIVGQPTAYVDGQPVRNLMRYIFP